MKTMREKGKERGVYVNANGTEKKMTLSVSGNTRVIKDLIKKIGGYKWHAGAVAWKKESIGNWTRETGYAEIAKLVIELENTIGEEVYAVYHKFYDAVQPEIEKIKNS